MTLLVSRQGLFAASRRFEPESLEKTGTPPGLPGSFLR
jgi:hypothetical protein